MDLTPYIKECGFRGMHWVDGYLVEKEPHTFQTDNPRATYCSLRCSKNATRARAEERRYKARGMPVMNEYLFNSPEELDPKKRTRVRKATPIVATAKIPLSEMAPGPPRPFREGDRAETWGTFLR